jgi:hypothetical protein
MNFNIPIPGMGRILDATTLKDYLHCPTRYWWRHVKCWVPDKTEFALHFGLAVHAGLEIMYKWIKRHPGKNIREGAVTITLDGEKCEMPVRQAVLAKALEVYNAHVPEDQLQFEELRTSGKLVEVLTAYMNMYGHETFFVLSVEEAFALGVTATGYTTAQYKGTIPDDGRLFSWVGKMDIVADLGGYVLPMDHKTTRMLGPSFAQQWQIDVQMSGYTQVAKLLYPGKQIPGAMINAIQVAKSKSDFERVLANRNEAQLSAHHHDLLCWTERLGNDTEFPQNSTSCGAYGNCPYVRLCLRYPNPSKIAKLPLEDGFREDTWNPMTRLD